MPEAVPGRRDAGAWHGSGYLALGGLLALPALLLAVLTTLGAFTTLVLVGGLLLTLAVPLTRRLAGLQRRRTGLFTARPVPELYSRAGGTLVTRVEAMLRDPATWRDLLWLWTFSVLAVVGLLLCWVPWLAPRLAQAQARHTRALLSPTAKALRRSAERMATEPAIGHGLVGMRERVTVLGGTLTAGPLDGGGFEVVAELPTATSDDGTGTVRP